MSRSSPRCALVALLSLLPTPLVAQVASDSVPKEFVEVFLGGGMRRSELHIGRLPAELEGVVPRLPGGRVVGATHPFYGGILAVIAFDTPPNEVQGLFEEALAREGWSHAPPSEGTGGFVSSEIPTYNLWCSTASAIQPSVQWRNGVSYLRISYSERDRSPCDADERMRTPRIDYGVDLPTLVAPPGVEQRGGGRGGSSREVESTAQLQGPLPPSVLARLYGAQLEAAGWAQLESLDGVGVSVRRYTVTGTDGSAWQGLLTLWESSDGIIFGKVVAARPEPF